MNQINKEKLDNYQQDGMVFKSCYTYIVVLKKTPDTITNEKRVVSDKLYAKFRGNKFIVVDIFPKFGDGKRMEVHSDYDSSFTYRISETVTVKDYVDNDSVCDNGVHYYLSWEPAFYHNYYIFRGIYTGVMKCWGSNGVLEMEYNFVDGKKCGEAKSWHSNGVIKIKCHFNNNNMDGNYKLFYDNNKLHIECNYNNGRLEGLYQQYDRDGQLLSECNYENGDKIENTEFEKTDEDF